ncbi:M23 family metallopeptidase [Nannocystis sp. ILAH1]|uniref:M23 family metallopeptidase n=1 Tax=Nannocystis sp. ILAH1 TaxID=2996789 RepID=UPI00226F8473|nr:M23 family metallopeptidase [Nannocystis sp. ILAH1]
MIPPLPQQVLLELEAVQWAVENKPEVYDGYQRKAGQEDQYWFANVAYWRAYPLAPKQLPKNPKPDEKVWVDTWLRIHQLVLARIAAQQPAPAWNGSSPRWPLSSPPKKWKPGSKFGVKRPWGSANPTRFHCGIDLSAGLGTPVLAPESGVILAVDQGWEAPAKAVILHLDSGLTALMGGVAKGSSPPKGTRVCPGQAVGCMTDVVAKIGPYPNGSTMLHFQLYKRHLTVSELNKQKAWYADRSQPPDLIDPADYLTAAMNGTPLDPANAASAFYGFTPEEPAGDIEAGEQNEGGEDLGDGKDNGTSEGGPPAKVASSSSALPWLLAGGVLLVGGAAAFAFTGRNTTSSFSL